MEWSRDGVFGHAGWVANVLADGRASSRSNARGVIVHGLIGDDVVAERAVRRYPNTDHVDVVIPWDQVVTWRVTCQCGWIGVECPAIADTVSKRRDCPAEIEDRIFAPAWNAHVAPYVALHDLDDLTDLMRDIEQRVAATVRLARAAGASWTQIGRAARLSRQGAQQRWG